MPLTIQGILNTTPTLKLTAGNVTNPGLAFANATSTGLFVTDRTLGISSNGIHVANFSPGNVVVDASFRATSVAGNGSGLFGIPLSNTIGILDQNRLPANISGNGAGLTSLNASNVTTGTLGEFRLPTYLHEANLTGTSNASNITSGVLAVAYGGTGSTNASGTGNVVLNTSPTLQGNVVVNGNLAVSGTGGVTATNFIGNGSQLTGLEPLLTVSNVQVTDSLFTVLDDTAISNTGGYCLINGTGFDGNTNILVGASYPPSSLTVVSGTQLRASLPAMQNGTYPIFAFNNTRNIVKMSALQVSPLPVWSTATTLSNVTKTVAFTQSLVASEGTGSNVSYTLANGSSLPPNTSLVSTGVLSGNITVDPSNTTIYSFTVEASDQQYQNVPRTFSLSAFPTYVINGLMLYYDSGISTSYPGTGTTWTDLSGSGNNGTLVNGVTYMSANGGAMVFDGVNDAMSAVTLGNPNGQLTCEIGMNYNNKGNSHNIFDRNSSRPMLWVDLEGRLELSFGTSSGGLTSANVYAGQNIIATAVYNSVSTPGIQLYINGSLVDIQNTTHVTWPNPSTFTLFNRDAVYNFSGKVFFIRFYNRALTAQEILQNSNSTRGRFGI